MKDTEIIKALECCNTVRTEQHCDTCPFYEHEKCTISMLDEAVTLINRQKAEIERYKGVIKILENDVQTSRTEAIREFEEKLKKGFASLEHRPEIHRKTIEVEKFTNIVNWVLHEVTTKEIDRVVKEMVGETDEH